MSRDNTTAGIPNAPTNSRLLQHAHGQAHAIDVMVGTNTALGWQVATWAAANAAALQVKYVIFAGQIIDSRALAPAWHTCRDPASSCAQNHFNHVHISFTANA